MRYQDLRTTDAWVINRENNIEHVDVIKAKESHLLYFLRCFATSIQEPRIANWGDVFPDELTAMRVLRDRFQNQADWWTDQISIKQRTGVTPTRKASLLYGG